VESIDGDRDGDRDVDHDVDSRSFARGEKIYVYMNRVAEAEAERRRGGGGDD